MKPDAVPTTLVAGHSQVPPQFRRRQDQRMSREQSAASGRIGYQGVRDDRPSIVERQRLRSLPIETFGFFHGSSGAWSLRRRCGSRRRPGVLWMVLRSGRPPARITRRSASFTRRLLATTLTLRTVATRVDLGILESPRFEFPFQPFGEPYSSEGRRIRCALTGQFTQHGFHRRRQAHIELGRIVLENCFPKNLV